MYVSYIYVCEVLYSSVSVCLRYVSANINAIKKHATQTFVANGPSVDAFKERLEGFDTVRVVLTF